MWIVPDWPAPKRVRALSTTRCGGESHGVYAGLNLGMHVGDDAESVQKNRDSLQDSYSLPCAPNWLNQTHSIDVIKFIQPLDKVTDGDASYTQNDNVVCVAMTADCLPVLLCDEQGNQVAAVHAGWRGLVDGIIEKSVLTFAEPKRVMAWLGPAIGAQCFEVGDDVRDQFMNHDPKSQCAFTAHGHHKWLADMSMLACQRLADVGVTAVYGGDLCTYSDSERFYSYRRDGVTGRQASLIWLSPE